MSLPSGIRIPLIIDASILIGGLITVTLMWADIRSVKTTLSEDRQQITDGRIVRLEEQQKAMQRELDGHREQLGKLWQRRREERRIDP